MNKQAAVLLLTAAFMTFAGCVSNEARTPKYPADDIRL